MEDHALHEQLISRLDIIIRLLLCQPQSKAGATMTDMISRLHEMALTPAVIARIVGKKANYVAAILGQRKRAKGTGKK